jgi:hypothetical protein
MRCFVLDGRLCICNPSAICQMIFGKCGDKIVVDPTPVRIRMVPDFPPPWPQHARRVIALYRESTGEFVLYGDSNEAEEVSRGLGYGGATAIRVKTFSDYISLKKHPRLSVMYPKQFVVTDDEIRVCDLRFPRYLATHYFDEHGCKHDADYELPHYRANVRVHLMHSGLAAFYGDYFVGLWSGVGLPQTEDAKRAMQVIKPGERVAWGNEVLIVFSEPERVYYRWMEMSHWGIL